MMSVPLDGGWHREMERCRARGFLRSISGGSGVKSFGGKHGYCTWGKMSPIDEKGPMRLSRATIKARCCGAIV